MKTLIVNDTPFELSQKDLQTQVKNIGQSLLRREIISSQVLDLEITLVFLGKLEAKKLNWQYRQKDYPTDILSFEGLSPESLGELVFCPEVLEAQAKEHGQSFQQELSLMLIHGVLHLLGFDHEEGGEEERKMMALQEDLFKELVLSPKKKVARKKTSPKKKTVAKKKTTKATKKK